MGDYISREEAIKTIQYRVCQGYGNKEHICKSGSCAYCGIMEIMNDISSIEAVDVERLTEQKSNGIVADAVREWDGDLE